MKDIEVTVVSWEYNKPTEEGDEYTLVKIQNNKTRKGMNFIVSTKADVKDPVFINGLVTNVVSTLEKIL